MYWIEYSIYSALHRAEEATRPTEKFDKGDLLADATLTLAVCLARYPYLPQRTDGRAASIVRRPSFRKHPAKRIYRIFSPASERAADGPSCDACDSNLWPLCRSRKKSYFQAITRAGGSVPLDRNAGTSTENSKFRKNRSTGFCLYLLGYLL